MDDTKNPVLNPLDPPGTNPPADPPTPPPSSMPDAPPAAPFPQDTPPAPPIETPQTDVPTPEEQPTETGPPAGEAGGLPPVITPPPTSSGPKAKIIASIIGLILLVVSIPAGIILVGRQQEIREKAAENCIEQAKAAAKSRGAPDTRQGDIASASEVAADVCGRGTLESFKAGTDTGVQYGVGQATTTIYVAPTAKVGLEKACSKQEECQDNLTCVGSIGDPASGKLCRLNSGQGNCCDLDEQCKNFGQGGGKCTKQATLCASGKACVETGSATDPTTGQSTPNIQRSGRGGPCQNQTQCQDNHTCSGGVCKLNSLQGNCCDIKDHCPSDATCTGTDPLCLSGKSCLKSETASPPAAGGGGGACAITGIDVYEYPFTGVAVTNRDNKFKAGDLVRFVAQVPTNARKVEICEGSDCAARSKATLPDGSLAFYRDIRLGNVGSVTIKARCTF